MGNHEGETKEERKLRRQKKKELKELKEQKRKRKRKHNESSQEQSSPAVSAIDQPSKEMKVEETTNSVPPTQKAMSPSLTHSQKDDLSKSPFQKRTIDCIISLQPSALVDITKALNQSMKNRLLQYFASYGGVLLSFENLNIISKSSDGSTCGLIWNEMPHMNFIVRVDILIFCPDIGIKVCTGTQISLSSHSVGIKLSMYFSKHRKFDFIFTNNSSSSHLFLIFYHYIHN